MEIKTINLTVDRQRINKPIDFDTFLQGSPNFAFLLTLADDGTQRVLTVEDTPSIQIYSKRTKKMYKISNVDEDYAETVQVIDGKLKINQHIKLCAFQGEVELSVLLNKIYTYQVNYSLINNPAFTADLIEMASGIGTNDHTKLINRNKPSQHEIEAIEGLRAELDSKVELTYLDETFVKNTTDNLVNYYTKDETYSKEEINAKINAIPHMMAEFVDVLPEIGDPLTLYLIPSETSEINNVYKEYYYIKDKFELIGSTAIDLNGYALKSEIPTKLSDLENDVKFTSSEITYNGNTSGLAATNVQKAIDELDLNVDTLGNTVNALNRIVDETIEVLTIPTPFSVFFPGIQGAYYIASNLSVTINADDNVYQYTTGGVVVVKKPSYNQVKFSGKLDFTGYTTPANGTVIPFSIVAIDPDYNPVGSVSLSITGDGTTKIFNIKGVFNLNITTQTNIQLGLGSGSVSAGSAKLSGSFALVYGDLPVTKTNFIDVVSKSAESYLGTATTQNKVNEQFKTAVVAKADKTYVDSQIATIQTNLNNYALTTTVTNLVEQRVAKIGGTMTGALRLEDVEAPLTVKPTRVDGGWRTLFVGVENDKNGIEKTMFEIFASEDGAWGGIEFKAVNPIDTTKNFFLAMYPGEPLKVKQNDGDYRYLAYADEVPNGKRLTVKNKTTTEIPSTGTVLSNTVNIVVDKNDIGATVSSNVITLPVGVYDLIGTVNVTKAGNTDKTVQFAIVSNGTVIPEGMKYLDWGTNTAAKHTETWMGCLDVVGAPMQLNLGVLASTAGISFNTDAYVSGLVLHIKKVG